MTAEELAGRLQGRRAAAGWTARCPAHDDRHPSLSIREADDGRVLLKCHAGCSFDAIVAALGLTPTALAPSQPGHIHAARPHIVATYDYTDGNGRLLFQTVRLDPKDFRQRRPDPARPGAWIWNLSGVTRVLYRLLEVLRARNDGRTVFVVEGEKDANALAGLGFCATCNPGGAGKWLEAYGEYLNGVPVVIVPDRDSPGRRHAEMVRQALAGKAKSVRLLELPDREGRKIKDAADWIVAGGTAEELQRLVDDAPPQTPLVDDSQLAGDAKPEVHLPHGSHSISAAGRILGECLARTGRFFLRDGAVTRLTAGEGDAVRLERVSSAALASDIEDVASLVKSDRNGEVQPAVCTEQAARLIGASEAFRFALPPLRVLTHCPVLVEREGTLVQVIGYDRATGVYAGGRPAQEMELDEARNLLDGLLAEFMFATPSDRSRALAALITPALVLGGLLEGRAPIDLGEAADSQTGKGYRNKLKAAVYASRITAITPRRSGVGSLEELLSMALIRGANFICVDNVRGQVDCPALESLLTEDTFVARAPFSEPIEVDPRRTCLMLTSNKADLTTDLAKRSSCVHLLKQPEAHDFRSFPEGDLLAHVSAHQPRYLGAIFTVVQAWHAAGKPRTAEKRHDFRAWAQTLDWIVQNLLQSAPLLEGHRETQVRMTNPVLNWLRDVAHEVIRGGQAGAWLRAGDLIELLAETPTETPGLPEQGDLSDGTVRDNVLRATGRRLRMAFKSGEELHVAGMIIERREVHDPVRSKDAREYRFRAPPMVLADRADAGQRAGEWTASGVPSSAREGVSTHANAHGPPMQSPTEPQCPPISSFSWLLDDEAGLGESPEETGTGSFGVHGRMGGLSTDSGRGGDASAGSTSGGI